MIYPGLGDPDETYIPLFLLVDILKSILSLLNLYDNTLLSAVASMGDLGGRVNMGEA